MGTTHRSQKSVQPARPAHLHPATYVLTTKAPYHLQVQHQKRNPTANSSYQTRPKQLRIFNLKTHPSKPQTETTTKTKMSPRNDALLSLCLAQAELSPLHYRHGAIIVRGGKVIGQGFNCYRPGFDGGALKSGALPSASLDGPSIAEFKQRLKSKPKNKSKTPSQPDEGTFTPFESMGCGHNANVALSMHSEMMAIRSALSLSSGTQASQTSARSAKCFEKPYFKLSDDSKNRKARARALKAYAKAICKEAASSGTDKAYGGASSMAKSRFESSTLESGSEGQWQRSQRQGGGSRVSERETERERGGEHMEKCRETASEE